MSLEMTRCADGRCRAGELEQRVAERQRELLRQRQRLRELGDRLGEAHYLVRRLWQTSATAETDGELAEQVRRFLGG